MSTIQNKKIVAKEYPLKDILSNNKYSIDYFQREYRWRKENIDQLIDDLYNAFRADYRPEHSTKDVANYASYLVYRQKEVYKKNWLSLQNICMIDSLVSKVHWNWRARICKLNVTLMLTVHFRMC